MLIHDTLAVGTTLINRKTLDPNEILENCSDSKSFLEEHYEPIKSFLDS